MVGVTLPQAPVTGCIDWKKWFLVTNTRQKSNKGIEKNHPHTLLSKSSGLSEPDPKSNERKEILFPSASAGFGERALLEQVPAVLL